MLILMNIIYGRRSLLCFTSAHKHLLMSRDRTSMNAKAIMSTLVSTNQWLRHYFYLQFCYDLRSKWIKRLIRSMAKTRKKWSKCWICRWKKTLIAVLENVMNFGQLLFKGCTLKKNFGDFRGINAETSGLGRPTDSVFIYLEKGVNSSVGITLIRVVIQLIRYYKTLVLVWKTA